MQGFHLGVVKMVSLVCDVKTLLLRNCLVRKVTKDDLLPALQKIVRELKNKGDTLDMVFIVDFIYVLLVGVNVFVEREV